MKLLRERAEIGIDVDGRAFGHLQILQAEIEGRGDPLRESRRGDVPATLDGADVGGGHPGALPKLRQSQVTGLASLTDDFTESSDGGEVGMLRVVHEDAPDMARRCGHVHTASPAYSVRSD